MTSHSRRPTEPTNGQSNDSSRKFMEWLFRLVLLFGGSVVLFGGSMVTYYVSDVRSSLRLIEDRTRAMEVMVLREFVEKDEFEESMKELEERLDARINRLASERRRPR